MRHVCAALALALALAGPAGTEHAQRLYRGDRERIRRQAAYEGLNLLRLAMR